MPDIRNIETFMYELGRQDGRRAARDLAALDVQRVEIVKPHRTAADAAGDIVGGIAALAIGAWQLMLAAGGIHSEIPGVPAFGYWTAALVLFAAGSIGFAAGLRPIPVSDRKPRR